jgi:DUF1365 family protein
MERASLWSEQESHMSFYLFHFLDMAENFIAKMERPTKNVELDHAAADLTAALIGVARNLAWNIHRREMQKA